MKYILLDDENELYKNMYGDLLKHCPNYYHVEELPRFVKMPKWLEKIRNWHFGNRANRFFDMPGKGLWTKFYELSQYKFDPKEEYWVIVLNGTLRHYYSYQYFLKLKKNHKNVRIAMVMYDSFSNHAAKRAISIIPVFDKVFSFDKADCMRYGLDFIYSTFSMPDNVKQDSNYYSRAFFVGAAVSRLDMLQRTFKRIAEHIDNCEFHIFGVNKAQTKYSDLIVYNKWMPYSEVLQYSYNTDCIVEIVREKQSGISLRVCEAVLFNKKLVTNNENVKSYPFYNPEYIHIFNTPEDIDLSFFDKKINVDYHYSGYFSPIVILDKLAAATKSDT